ncbi:MAG: family ATPase [Devosia sp.]|uniref:AAA family ATPase n=1 Tax=Devosia sp. TaxID=1871048 RepID=UPI00261395AF|nr:AAA family ATPase [Devosia sp.]MDB5529192.1 family ATPase [Devosia sp.]
MVTSKSSAGSNPLTELILQQLRANVASEPSSEVDDLSEPISVPGYGAEHVLAAHLIGLALAPHFQSLNELATTTQFIAITVRTTEDAGLMASVLKVVLSASGAIVEPQYQLRAQDKYPIFIGSGSRIDERLRLAADAGRRGLPVVWLYDPEASAPAQFTTVADVIVDASTLTRDMLAAAFVEFFGRMPANFSDLGSPSKLAASDLALHFRRGRSPEACVDSLKSLMPKEPVKQVDRARLQDQHGYGEARVWGLELAQDFEIWRRGQLSWEEVDHRSVLLAGPPGTGKTSFAGLLAGTLHVPLIASSVAEWNTQDYLSGTLKKMRMVFNEAMEKAPCVLLVDELDGISSRQSISGRYAEYWTQIVNLMLELVTQATTTPGLVLVGATNYVERIDPALTRSGRLDHTIIMKLPSSDEITAILAHYAGSSIAKKELRTLAPKLQGKTGADIEKLVRAARATARRAGRPFSISALHQQVPGVFEKLPPEVRRRIATYRAGQVVVAQALDMMDVAAEEIVDFSGTLSRTLEAGHVPTGQDYNDAIAVLMAGRAAEEILFGGASLLGVGSNYSDLALATAWARQIETRSGLGEAGLVDLEDPVLRTILPAAIVGSVRRRLDAAIARASGILLDRREEMEAIVAATVRGAGLAAPQPPRRVLN